MQSRGVVRGGRRGIPPLPRRATRSRRDSQTAHRVRARSSEPGPVAAVSADLAFKLHGDVSWDKELRRVMCEQIDDALSFLASGGHVRGERVHKARTCCKKVRAVLRLVRPRDEDFYQRENAELRNAARLLSAVRDAEVMVHCHDKLMKRLTRHGARRARFARIRRQLGLKKRDVLGDAGKFQHETKVFAAKMRKARRRIASHTGKLGNERTVMQQVKTIYRAARHAMRQVRDDSADEAWHEWRKRTKTYGYVLRLLHDARKPVLEAMREEVDELSELLGDDHDLAMFDAALADQKTNWGPAAAVRALRRLIKPHRKRLQRASKRAGAIVFADRPSDVARRLDAWWTQHAHAT
jgi:CHAD domain-containing protein